MCITRYILRPWFTALGVYSTFALLVASPVWARQANSSSGQTAAQVIEVTATGEVKAKPDLSRITLGVETRNSVASTALQENARKSEALLKTLRTAGVEQSDIQTSGFSIRQDQEAIPGTGGGGREPSYRTYYEVTNSVRVTVRKVSDTGRIIDATIKAGGTMARSIIFDLNDANRAKAKETALTQAVMQSRRQAEVIARAANLGRVDPLSFVLDINGGQLYADPETANVSRYSGGVESSATITSAGEVVIRVAVTARYRFTPEVAANYPTESREGNP